MKTIKILATDGIKTIAVAWVRMGENIYGCMAHPTVKFHRSYHRDGTIHWKFEHAPGLILGIEESVKPSGYSKETIKAEPPMSLSRPVSFLSGGVGLDQVSFDTSPADTGKKTDRIVMLHSHIITSKQKFVNFFVDFFPLGSYSALGHMMATRHTEFSQSGFASDFHCYLDFQPWVLVTLSYVTSAHVGASTSLGPARTRGRDRT